MGFLLLPHLLQVGLVVDVRVPLLADMTLWLGYIASTINPLIYTVFNAKFR